MNFKGLSKIGLAAWAVVSGLFIGVTAVGLWNGIANGNLAMIVSSALTAFGWAGIMVVRFGGRE